MNKVFISTVIALAGIMLLVQPAAAVTFSMSPEQIQALYETYEDPNSSSVLYSVQANAQGAKFVGDLVNQGWAQMQIGANYWGIPFGGSAGDAPTNMALGLGSLAGYDAFGLNFYNYDENPWKYNLYFNVGYTGSGEADYYVQGNWTEVAGGQNSGLILDFTNAQVWGGGYNGGSVDLFSITGLNLAHISNIGFAIGANVPQDGMFPDYTFETIVTPVPEPASMLLLGPALLGLIRFKKKKS